MEKHEYVREVKKNFKLEEFTAAIMELQRGLILLSEIQPLTSKQQEVCDKLREGVNSLDKIVTIYEEKQSGDFQSDEKPGGTSSEDDE